MLLQRFISKLLLTPSLELSITLSKYCLPALAMCLIIGVVGSDIRAGRMRVADFFTFSLYVFQLTFPTFIMGWVVALVQRGAASMQRLDELLSVEPTIADHPDAEAPAEFRGGIELRGLTVRYPGAGADAD